MGTLTLNEVRLRDEFGHPPNPLVLGWAIQRARNRGDLVLIAKLHSAPDGKTYLLADDTDGAQLRVPVPDLGPQSIGQGLRDVRRRAGRPITVFPHESLAACLRDFPDTEDIRVSMHGYRPVLRLPPRTDRAATSRPGIPAHLRQLEAESIHIMREVLAEARNPVMLYSLGKDSGVMLHLARKAFFPGQPPFPLLHVDTLWKFQEMYLFREFMARESGMELRVHVNPEAIARNINPFDHGSALHTDITMTQGLKQALDQHKFDVVFSGARRDEEKSRAKERVFSSRTENHRWDSRNQRPELWQLDNTRMNPRESIRVFPLANWTALDIWQYTYHEQIPVVPLYFARPRPVVVRSDMIMMVDDERCRLLPGDEIEIRNVRFRSLGCYPLTSAVESEAKTVEDILVELIEARHSDPQGRTIDSDGFGSMERKKQGGHF